MTENRIKGVNTRLINQTVRADHRRWADGKMKDVSIRQMPVIWRIEEKGRSNLDIHAMRSAQSHQTFEFPPVQPGQKVYCRDGYAGKVSAIRISHQPEHQTFVVQTGRFFRRRFIVPYEWLDRIESQRVYLSVKKDELKTLPEERPDPILVIEVRRALREDMILRGAWIKGIDVSARHGFISLDGYVPDATQKARAEKTARRIPGVLGVENCLVVDEELKLAVARAVTQISDNPVARVFVGAHDGFITLTGEVSSVETRMVAEERAGNVPRVRGVLNSLRVAGGKFEFSEPRALQPRIGTQVYATDMVLGHVEQVIVDRVNRLVTAILVDGMFPEPREKRTHWFLDGALVRRRVVIPVHAIRHQTDTAVFLGINFVEASLFDDFKRADFSLPDASWRAPYPYHRDNVLLTNPPEEKFVPGFALSQCKQQER